MIIKFLFVFFFVKIVPIKQSEYYLLIYNVLLMITISLPFFIYPRGETFLQLARKVHIIQVPLNMKEKSREKENRDRQSITGKGYDKLHFYKRFNYSAPKHIKTYVQKPGVSKKNSKKIGLINLKYCTNINIQYILYSKTPLKTRGIKII